jgi:phosphoglycerate dehydrogenase-like enzyme
MNGKILVTDTLFIYDNHIRSLEGAGYHVVRVEKPDLSEQELSKAIKGKVGYILGGTEYVTEKVIDSADKLKAIVFTGTGFKGHIPAWEYALEKGIQIGTTPYANVYEVAEWALAATLAMQRNLFDLSIHGKTTFHTITSLPDLKVGIIGLGHIGNQYAQMISSVGAGEVVYWNRSPKNSNYKYVEKDELFTTCDIIFVALSEEAGKNFISKSSLELMKKDALLVSIAGHGIINEEDLFGAMSSGQIRAALDIISDNNKFKNLPQSRFYGSKSSAAYNSIGYLHRSSDMATETIINLLTGDDDPNKVQP